MKKKNDDNFNHIKKYLICAAVSMTLLMIVFGTFYTVSAGERAVLLTFGKPADIAYTEGLHFKIPLIQQVVKMDIKTQKYETGASAASKDLQVVSTNLAVNYHLEQSSTVEIYKTIGVDFNNKIIQPAVQEVVKASTAQFTAEQLITQRDQVKQLIDTNLGERLSSRGIVLETTSITNFDFSEEFNKAIESKVTAEQNALTAKNKLSQVEYEAKQRITQADAEAKAIEIQANAITVQGGEDYVKLQAINKWDGHMPEVTGGAIPFIDIKSISGGEQ